MEVLVVFAMNLKEKRKKKTRCIPKSIMKREKRVWIVAQIFVSSCSVKYASYSYSSHCDKTP